MIKKIINQKGKLDEELINIIQPNFVFNNTPINRLNTIKNNNVQHSLLWKIYFGRGGLGTLCKVYGIWNAIFWIQCLWLVV